MYERLLILQPDRAQTRRLGWTRVTAANVTGLALGLAIAITVIAALAA